MTVTYSRTYPNLNWKSPAPGSWPDLNVATRDPRYYPFASESVWRIGVGSDATFEANTNGTATYQFHNTAGVASGVNSSSWSVAVGITTTADPFRTVTCDTTADTWNIRIPDSLNATGGSDGWVTVVQPDGYTCYEFYAAVKNPASNPGGWSTRYPLIVTDLREHGLNGRRASLTSQLAGLIRKDELANLNIQHALGLAIPKSMLKLTPTLADGDNIGANSSGGGYVWPARGADNQANIAYTGMTAMGAVFAIPPSVDVTALGLTPTGLALARACQDYGVVIIAQAEHRVLAVEPAANQTQVSALRTAWPTVCAQLRRMTNSIGGSIDAATRVPLDSSVILGGGTRRRPLLPPPTP